MRSKTEIINEALTCVDTGQLTYEDLANELMRALEVTELDACWNHIVQHWELKNG